MELANFLNQAKVVCCRFVEEAFPQEQDVFDEVWKILVPLFEKWAGLKPSLRRFSGADVSLGASLGFNKGPDWAMPIGMTVITATMLELWDSPTPVAERDARTTVRKYADSFGAPDSLQKLLEEKVPGFCLELCNRLSMESFKGDSKGKTRDIEAPEVKRPMEDYLILTHKQAAKRVTLQELVSFKKQHSPKEFFIWIDESQGEVFVNNKPLPLGAQSRRVLRHLVEFGGQRITHYQLVESCGRVKGYDDVEKTSRRWMINLWQAGKGRLRNWIKTKGGGFVYEGPKSFCIIAPLS
jgi:hypothetical protein